MVNVAFTNFVRLTCSGMGLGENRRIETARNCKLSRHRESESLVKSQRVG